jgi:hypothetical protein
MQKLFRLVRITSLTRFLFALLAEIVLRSGCHLIQSQVVANQRLACSVLGRALR